MPERDYLEPFWNLLADPGVNRALILMGPRRVGKTVLVFQTIRHLIDSAVAPRDIFYLSLETPIFTGLALEKLIGMYKAQFARA